MRGRSKSRRRGRPRGAHEYVWGGSLCFFVVAQAKPGRSELILLQRRACRPKSLQGEDAQLKQPLGNGQARMLERLFLRGRSWSSWKTSSDHLQALTKESQCEVLRWERVVVSLRDVPRRQAAHELAGHQDGQRNQKLLGKRCFLVVFDQRAG